MRRSSVLAWSALVFFGAGAAGVVGQSRLPDAPGREDVLAVCGKCHEADRAASVRLTPDGWTETVANMRTRGAVGTEEQFARALDYLVANFRGEAARALNMNTAVAVDLESVVGLLRREAAVYIAFRDKNGPFGSIDDLKKLDAAVLKKIRERQDRIVFLAGIPVN